MRSALRTAALFTVFVFYCSYQRVPPSKHFTIQSLGNGIWVAINNDYYGHAICNAGIVDLGDKTLVFDPFMNVDAAEDLKAVCKQLTGRDASIVVDSHYHNDHIRGNQVFPNATIISTEWTRNEMAISEPQELKWEKENAPKQLSALKARMATASGREREELPLWIGYYEGMVVNDPKVKTRLPNLTFTDSLWIYGAKNKVKLVECRGGHTASDLVLLIPPAGIAFMGDLLFEGRQPYLGDGVWNSWINHLQSFYSNDSLRVFLPGHGQLSGKPEIRKMIDYITDVHDLVQSKITKGEPDSVIMKTRVPSAYEGWKYSQFFAANLDYFIQQLKGPGKK